MLESAPSAPLQLDVDEVLKPRLQLLLDLGLSVVRWLGVVGSLAANSLLALAGMTRACCRPLGPMPGMLLRCDLHGAWSRTVPWSSHRRAQAAAGAGHEGRAACA